MSSTRPRPSSNSRARHDRSCLVFLHIPKTAGVTVSTALRYNFRPLERMQVNALDRPLDEEIEKIPLEERARARLLLGHMPYGAHRHIPHPCEYITVLREPIARIISVYKFILRESGHPLHARVIGEHVDLSEYVQSGMDEGQTDNSQTRQLSGRQFGPLDHGALEEAMRNLEGFRVVGLTERFEETFVLLRRTLRLRMPFYVTRNVAPPREIPERAFQIIRERNQLDVELYAFARDLFSEQIARQKRSFGLEVSMFKAWRPLSRLLGGTEEGLIRKLSRFRARRGSAS